MLKSLWRQTAVRHSLIIFLVLRLFLSGWAMVALQVSPLPEEPNEAIRPYLNQPILNEGAAGLLLGPWQRFDALHYTRIAAEGYAHPEDSVFPPIYPLLIWALGGPFGELLSSPHAAHMATGIFISNAALLGLFILLHKVGSGLLGPEHAPRLLLYFALFPTGFFLFAPYSESLFLLLTLASLWLGFNNRLEWAGLLGLLAALTRLTGWVLIVPLAYQFWRRHLGQGAWKIGPIGGWYPKLYAKAAAVFLPMIGFILFVLYRSLLGLPGLSHIYTEYWFQRTGIPGTDLLRALPGMVGLGTGRAGEFTLWFDFFVTLLLLVTTAWAFFRWQRRLGWGLYAAMLLFFMLLPSSEFKPLYSFSRYALAFFPTFFLLATAGANGKVHRLILYPFIMLYLYFSAQFFVWGWVA
ncbi:MAG: hypothetical protein CL608_18060 [Anaerolineaceae bacterium]|nr:hypothetical protein [Anaerolineaceae bacterium]